MLRVLCSLETHNGIHSAFNIGYMLFRKSALPLVEEWRAVIQVCRRRTVRVSSEPHRTAIGALSDGLQNAIKSLSDCSLIDDR